MDCEKKIKRGKIDDIIFDFTGGEINQYENKYTIECKT